MAKLSKRMRAINEKVEPGRSYNVADACALLQELSSIKFNESVDVSVKLGIDARKSEQAVRGAIVLPNGTGRDVRVAVFAQGDKADVAREAGADIVGFEDLAEQVKKGEMDFDLVIASPDAMALVGKLGQILGPRGLMPNPKVGTVSPDIEKAVKDAKAGQVQYRIDKAGIIHCSIGKLNFTAKAIEENLTVLLSALKKAKPATAKGVYMKKVTLSSSMGPGLTIDMAGLNI